MSDLALAIKLTTEGGQIVVKELSQIGTAAGNTNKALTATDPAGKAAGSGLTAASAGAATLNTHMKTLLNTVGVVAGGLSAMALIDKGDEWGQYAARIRKATKDADEYSYVQQRMVSSANDTFRAINETKESFIQMSPILRDMGYQLSQSIDIVDSFSSQLVINAANSERASSAQAALAKSIQAGKIDADAWQTIFGVMPSVLDNLTAATGKTGTEIRQLGVTGKLSITDLTNALLQSYEDNRKAVEAMPTTVRDALQSLNTVFSEYIGWQNEAKGVTAGLADGIVFLAEHFDSLVKVVGVTAGGALLGYAIQAGIATKATVSKMWAAQAATAQELRLAQAQVIQAKQTLVQAAVMARASGAHAQATVAAESYRAAVTRLTAAQAAHTTVARGMLGVLGGPAGLALMAGVAAVSFLSFSSSTDDVKASLQELEQPFDSLVKKFKAFNNDQKAAALIKWGDAEREAVSQANKAFDDLLGRYAGVMRASVGFGESLNLANQLREAKAAGEDLTPILERVGAEAGVSPDRIQEWIKLAGAYADNKAAAEQAAKAIAAVKDASSTPADQVKPNLPTEENKELEKALLGVYNAQLLNATAVDAYGASLDGINLELFKAQFIEATKLPEDAAASIRKWAAEAMAAEKNLDISKHITQLQQEIGLMDVRLAQGEQEYEIQKALAQFTGADPARLSALQAELALLQKKQLILTDRTTLASLTKENDLLMVRLAHGEKEYEIQKALAALKGKDPAVLKAIEAELRLRQQLGEQIKTSEEIASGAFSKALDDMTALSSAGQTFGDALTQAFGRVAQQIDGMAAAQTHYNAKFAELAREKERVNKLDDKSPEKAKALLDIKNTEARLTKENYQAQMGQFAALSGAASQMFGEQSKEREALHKLEMAFGLAEIAMSMQKAGANALTAITSAFSAPFPLNFAAGAAMMAIMASLGVFSGGSSASVPSAADRQASQGTGTVLGDSDAKSESIANTLDRIESLELDQYVELREINANIKSLSAGIANLAVSLVGNFGKFNEQNYEGQLGTVKSFGNQSFIDLTHKLDALSGGIVGQIDKLLGGVLSGIAGSIIGGISKTTKKLLDSGISFKAQELGDILATGLVDGSYYNVIETTKRKLWGLSKKTSQSTEYSDLDNALEAEFGRIFASIGNSITAAVDMLGLDTSKLLENFVIDLPALSFKDLSGDEIQAELEAIFSQQADLMVQYLVPAIGEYQQMGEGLYETLIRVAQEQAVFNAQLDALGLSLGDLSAALRIDVAQSIIELMGGVEAFRDLTSQYFASFYSETEQFDYLSKTVVQAFESMGLAVPGARDEFKALVDSLDLTTEAGQELFAQLMQLVPGLDEYFKAMDKQADAAEKAAEAEQKLAEQRAGFSDGFEKELQRLDMTPMQRSLDDLQGWYDEQLAIAQELGAETVFLERLYARKRSDIINAELAQLVNSIAAVSNTIAKSILDIQRQGAGWNETDYQNGQVNDLKSQLGVGDTRQQIAAIEQLQAAIMNRYSAEQTALNALAAQQQSVIDALKSSYAQLVSSIQTASSSIASSILDIQRQGAGWNEVGYQTGQINDLRSQLGLGSTADQVNTITQLQQAISGRYQAEVAANKQLQDAANQRYQTELAASQAMRQAAQQLLQAADAMLLSDASPELLGKQLTEAKSQFDTLLAAARGGDADAARQLQQVGGSYLNIAKDYYAQGSDEYADIFNQIQSAYRGIGASAPGEPAVPAEVRQYQQRDAQLQQAAIDELTGLQVLLDELEKQAAAEHEKQLAEAEAALARYQADTLALQQSTIDELSGLQVLLAELEAQAAADLATQTTAITAAVQSAAVDVATAIAAIPAPVIVVPPAPVDASTGKTGPVVTDTGAGRNDDLLNELQKQRDDAAKQNSELVRELSRMRNELTRTQELVYSSRRIA